MLAAACHEATGGNPPFLLSELLGETRREARPATEIEPDVVLRLGPEPIAAALLLRVGQLDPAAPALTRTVAVLGPQAARACQPGRYMGSGESTISTTCPVDWDLCHPVGPKRAPLALRHVAGDEVPAMPGAHEAIRVDVATVVFPPRAR